MFFFSSIPKIIISPHRGTTIHTIHIYSYLYTQSSTYIHSTFLLIVTKSSQLGVINNRTMKTKKTKRVYMEGKKSISYFVFIMNTRRGYKNSTKQHMWSRCGVLVLYYFFGFLYHMERSLSNKNIL